MAYVNVSDGIGIILDQFEQTGGSHNSASNPCSPTTSSLLSANQVTDYHRVVVVLICATDHTLRTFPLQITYASTFLLRTVDGAGVISYIPVVLGSIP